MALNFSTITTATCNQTAGTVVINWLSIWGVAGHRVQRATLLSNTFNHSQSYSGHPVPSLSDRLAGL